MSLPDAAQNPAAGTALAVAVPPPAPRHWPGPEGPAPRSALLGAAGAGALGAFAMVVGHPGVGWAVVALAVGTVAVLVARRRSSPGAVAWGGAALALVAVAALRDAGYLVALCLIAALAAGSLALGGGRTVRGLAAGASAGVAAGFRALPWAARGLAGRPDPRQARTGAAAAVAAVLVVVFGTLLASADHAFARLVDAALPSLDAGEITGAVGRFLTVGAIALGTGYLAAARPRFDDLQPAVPRLVRRVEWVLPLAALDVVFLVFVGVQAAGLLAGPPGDGDYSGYARAGFWQLDVVTVLTLLVLGTAARVAPRAERTDRLLLRVLLGTLAVCNLAVVASAIRRLSLYEEAYGFTRLRVLVGAAELWLGLVFLLVIVAGVRLRAGWLPRAVAGTGLAGLLLVAAVNPDRFIAERNVDRYLRTGDIDVEYLATLSAGAAPAYDRLPPGERACAFYAVAARLRETPDDWRTWNLDRSRAREILAAGAPATYRDCRWR
jgi:Domain of unknown function (DUF4173)